MMQALWMLRFCVAVDVIAKHFYECCSDTLCSTAA